MKENKSQLPTRVIVAQAVIGNKLIVFKLQK
ncbi:hypothetical protein SAMN05421766_10263 [Zobellia uliginosa]|uniref:Uncharacterized protein n=1 Tax=Zobellia uliginosa TaxID=143224 RepID=A0ABY1KL42_9FLAO|nr:hypothetical protein SAMN05421766_10263 [Zobellia uliginosa]